MNLRIQDALLQSLKGIQQKYLQAKLDNLAEEVASRPKDWVSKLPELKTSPSSILIFKPDDIGDAVQALPAIQLLKKSYPKAKLFLICQKKTKAIYEASGLLDEIADMDVQFQFVRFPVLNLKEALSRFSLKRFDAAIFLRTYSSFFSYFKQLPADALVHPKDPRMPSDSPYQVTLSMHGHAIKHQNQLMLELVSLLTRKNVEQEISYPPLNFGKVNARSHHVVLHPFAKYETKRFSEDKWKELLSLLVKKYPELEWSTIGGKEDPTLDLPAKVNQLQGKLSLTETGNLLQSSLAFIGNESGPGHLAAALGIPTLTLMGGHSDPNEWAPYGMSVVLRSGVPCSPCHRRVCPGMGLMCFEKLSVLGVLSPIEEFLNRARAKTFAPYLGMQVLDLNS